MMTASKAFIALCLLAVVGTVLVIGPTELRRLLPAAKTDIAAKSDAKPDVKPDTRIDIAAAAKPEANIGSKAEAKPDAPGLAAGAPQAAAPAPAPKLDVPAETQQQAAALPDLAPAKPAVAAETGPRFDVARVDDHGEAAVIAGQASPGARVELLRDGQPLDSVVADAAGQFVMTPPQLPAGSYELSLRAKAPDGTVTQSGRSMKVTIAEAAPPRPVPVAKQESKPVEKPGDRSDVVAALPSAAPHLAPASDRARPRSTGALKPRATESRVRAPATTAVASASLADALSAAPADSGGSRVIARGDSLWALSRLTYGDGARFAVIFNANRDKIHNPNLIYPGQTFVLPSKAE